MQLNLSVFLLDRGREGERGTKKKVYFDIITSAFLILQVWMAMARFLTQGTVRGYFFEEPEPNTDDVGSGAGKVYYWSIAKSNNHTE